MSQADSFDLTTDSDASRDVERDIADVVALRGLAHQGSSFEHEIAALPFAGELTRPCRRCRGVGSVALSDAAQASWRKRLAEARQWCRELEESGDATKVQIAGESYRNAVLEYRFACRCPDCQGQGSVVAPGVQRQRAACDRCGGSGRDAGARLCPKCGGGGAWSLGVPDSTWTTVRCWRCYGSGDVLGDDDAPTCLCPVCGGDSYTVPVTVRETGSSRKGRLPPGFSPADDYEHGSAAGAVAVPDGFSVTWNDEDELAKGARAAAVLEELREQDPRAATVLEAYYGPAGDRYGKVQTLGRGHVLWPLTAGGKELLKLAKASGEVYRDPLRTLAAMRAAEASAAVKHIPWQAHMRAAVAESRTLIEDARAALARVVTAA